LPNTCPHGFFANRFTVTNYFAFVNDVFDAFEGGFDAHCIYTDFCKAFDTVNHKILLNKLYTYGVRARPVFLSWTSTYISNRTRHVVLKGVRSSAYCSTSGVTQLDVFDLQEDVRRIENWCARNGMKLNVCKCKAMCFSRKTVPSVPYYSLEGEQLEIISVIKDLGLFLDSNLSFHEHYDFLISRGRKMLGWTVDFMNTRAIIILYNSLVRSTLEYNCVIWSPFYCTHISRIESVQNNFLKYLKYKLRTENINFDDLHSVAAYMSLPSLKTRRDCHKLCFLHKIINYKVDSSDALLRIGFNVLLCNLRHSNLFHVYCHKHNYSYNSPLNSALRLANLYCNELDFCGVSINKFKNDCKRFLCK
jgi:ribonuclease P/MRP protein subunit RPP40